MKGFFSLLALTLALSRRERGPAIAAPLGARAMLLGR
jgi:hypothetical protein